MSAFLATEQLLAELTDKHPSWHVFRDALEAVHMEAQTRGCICPADVVRLRVWWTDCPVHAAVALLAGPGGETNG